MANPTDEDSDLFAREVSTAVPLKHDKVLQPRQLPRPYPRQTRLDERQVLRDMLSDNFDPAELETGEELLFWRKGLQTSLLRKLRRGQFSIHKQLDLHGMTVPQAREALTQFLADCHASDHRCVRIIHGKGFGSVQKQPVLKGKLNNWLQQRDDVLAFCSARLQDGGTGAVYVLLKRG